MGLDQSCLRSRWNKGGCNCFDGATYGLIIVAFVVLLIAGQLVSDGRRTYPFVHWAMYTTPAQKAPIFLECHGVLADGEDVVIPAARIFKSLSVRLTRTWLKLAEAAVWSSFGRPRLSFPRPTYPASHSGRWIE